MTIVRLVAVVLAVLVMGCAKSPEPLRIGTNPWPGYEFLHLAEALGYFREEGVAVQLVTVDSLAAGRRAFEKNQVDVFGATVVELMLARENSAHRAQAFFVTNVSNGADVLLVRATIPGLKELKGRRIGIEPGSLDAVVAFHALRTAGLKFSDVTLVPVAQQAMRAALAEGRIDALASYPPVSTEIERSGLAKVVFDSRSTPNAIVDVLVADATTVATRGKDLAAVARAFDRARNYLATRREDALKILAGRGKMTPAEMDQALAGLALVPLSDQPAFLAPRGPLEQSLESAARVMVDTGLLRQAPVTAQLLSNVVVTAR